MGWEKGCRGALGVPPFAAWGRVGDGFCIGVWKSWCWSVYLSSDHPVLSAFWVEKTPSPPEQPSPPNFGALVGTGLPSLVSAVLGHPVMAGSVGAGLGSSGSALLHPPMWLVGFIHGMGACPAPWGIFSLWKGPWDPSWAGAAHCSLGGSWRKSLLHQLCKRG